jgi:hypothetical protein
MTTKIRHCSECVIIDKDWEDILDPCSCKCHGERELSDPIPDEYCPHVETKEAEMTGGWYFAANSPPKAVGMCHECIVWCREHLSPDGRMSWRDWQAEVKTTDEVLSADIIR